MKENRNKSNPRITYLNTIRDRDILPTHVVVSAIQGLYHVSEKNDEEYLFPLLDCKNMEIAGEAMMVLYASFHVENQFKDKIIQFASTNTNNEEGRDLQLKAIDILAELSINDKTILEKLIAIAERYQKIESESDSALVNAELWKILASHAGKKINGDCSNELIWNIHSERSDHIRNLIRSALKAKETGH